jgi:hypothetical protein
MNRLHLLPRLFAHQRTAIAETSPLPRPRRLIVLVPDIDFDVNRTARRARELSNLLDRNIQFLGICRDAADEPAIRRQLVTLSSIARDDRINTEVKVEPGLNWLEAVQTHWQPGDRIACFEGQRFGLRRRPLEDLLETRLEATVYVLPIPAAEARRRSKLAGKLLAWPGSLAIVAIFFWLQVRLTQLPQDWGHNSLLYISVIAEVGLIALWNAICA